MNRVPAAGVSCCILFATKATIGTHDLFECVFGLRCPDKGLRAFFVVDDVLIRVLRRFRHAAELNTRLRKSSPRLSPRTSVVSMALVCRVVIIGDSYTHDLISSA
jgi:hypothetical protein